MDTTMMVVNLTERHIPKTREDTKEVTNTLMMAYVATIWTGYSDWFDALAIS